MRKTEMKSLTVCWMLFFTLIILGTPVIVMGADISGTVKDSGGFAITGGGISVDAYSGEPCGENQHVEGTYTDTANGTYTITGLAGGTYYLRTSHNQTNYIDEWWNGGITDPSDYDCSLAVSITVAFSDTVTDMDFQLELGGSISGTVTVQGGSSIFDMHVYVQSEGCGGDWLGGSNTESNGDYTIKGIPVGNVYVQTCSSCSGLNYINESYNNKTDCNQANPVTVNLNADTPGINFQLEPGGSISGTVKDSGGTAITGSEINVDVYSGDPCGENQHVQGTSTNTANGTYTITGLAGGTYYLRTSHNQTNYVDEWWNGDSPDPSDYDCSLAESFTMISGAIVTEKDFQLDDGATISGTVYKSDGVTAIKDVEISVDAMSGDPCGENQHVQGTSTDTADGTYTITGLPAGTYFLRTWHNQTNYVDEWWNGSTDPSDYDCSLAQSITVALNDTVTGIDFQLDLGGSISGTVTDQGGFPIVNMHVYVQSESCGGDWLGGSNTDSNGYYIIKGIRVGGGVYVQTCSSCSGLNYIDESYDNKTDCDQADSVAVTQGTNTPNINFQLGMDTDGDGITDYDENNVYFTDPNDADTDSDGINDGDELEYWGSNWNDNPDGDGYSNLVDEDSDNDGYLDGEEVFKGSDPADSGSTPQTNLYDNFSGTYIDGQKWQYREFVREVDSGNLISKIGNNTNNLTIRNRTGFQNPESKDAVEATVTVEEINLDNGSASSCFARIAGRFYNTKGLGTEEGDIWAGVYIGDRGSGLEAYWEVFESDDDEGNSWTERGIGSLIVPGTLILGTAYTTKIEYNGGNQFTFTVNGISGSYTGPNRAVAEFSPYKGLVTGVDSDSGSGTGYISALFDDVDVNGSTYDNFDTAPLDLNLWNSREIVREITGDHKMLLAARTEGQREQSTLSFSEFQPYVEAKVIVKSESEVFNGAVGRIRIDGYFFNDTHGPGEYNGYEGNVWANVYIDLYDDGRLKADCYVGKSMNADESDWSNLFSDEFSIPIQTDREYTLGIHYTGSHFVFKCMDNVTSKEQYKTYEITATNQYAAYNQFTALRTRAYGNGSGDGYMKVQFDDVYVITGPVSSCPGDFDTDGDVDGSDLAVFAADFGRTDCGSISPCEGDFDGDSDVDGSDLALFAADFGRTDCLP